MARGLGWEPTPDVIEDMRADCLQEGMRVQEELLERVGK